MTREIPGTVRVTCKQCGHTQTLADDWQEKYPDTVCLVCKRELRLGKPRPDFDPRIDYPERYTDGPI